ncbi:aromatic amino acid transport family protein [Maridesulfovibrio hydrothermalis]|uniref:Aromatic amino acid permease n=1 Tax=Maridesulfovibrio hydrothermalis AM13 = DSM 14728 TaxID=1121451 RepID=L0RC95_9BACT|nr:aromatic amino acid transport family protein [Maridesulfovibrio hydrothermalis]CCO23820.1 Aromatic amino acid permease [Maridesulfovibrio hydrothermalis AM13 = DSM 14728]
MTQEKSASAMSMMFVVVGNMLGAGILALPVNLCAAGLIPSITATLFMWVLMTYTALIYSEQKSLTTNENADLPTFFQQELGNTGKWVTIVANLIILYGVLVAYICGISAIIMSIQSSLSLPMVMVLYFAVVTGITAFGMVMMKKCTPYLVIIMWVTFGALVFMVVPDVTTENMSKLDWSYIPAGLPVLLMAFHFHNIIPSICRTLDHDRRKIRTAIIGGTTIGMLMNLAWLLVVLGALPLSSPDHVDLITAFGRNDPATIPLENLLQTPAFTYIALLFALVAMSTAFMANGTALMSFMRDLTTTHLDTKSKPLVWSLSFIPPLLVALIYPDIFLVAINLVGGVGECIIFGILPGFIVWKYSPAGSFRKMTGMILIVCFAAVLLIELGQEFGLLHLSPNVEYWTHHTR